MRFILKGIKLLNISFAFAPSRNTLRAKLRNTLTISIFLKICYCKTRFTLYRKRKTSFTSPKKTSPIYSYLKTSSNRFTAATFFSFTTSA